VSICRARLHDTFNALTLRMSSEQICLRVSAKLFAVNSGTEWNTGGTVEFCYSGWSKEAEPFLLRRS